MNAVTTAKPQQTFGSQKAVTDICLLVDDIDRSVDFYVKKMGFTLRRKHLHFADFIGLGVAVAVWRLDHFLETAAIKEGALTGGRSCVCVQLQNYDQLDACYQSLRASGVNFSREIIDLPWNARGAYFTDPDGTFWELYAYKDGVSPD